jgi:hypothetical protein
MKTTIEISIDTDSLQSTPDEYLAGLWHAIQAADGPGDDRRLGELADTVGIEIIRRWLASTRPELHEHSLIRHYYSLLSRNGRWVTGEYVPNAAYPLDSAA